MSVVDRTEKFMWEIYISFCGYTTLTMGLLALWDDWRIL